MNHNELMNIFNRMIEEMDLVIIKAKAQIEYHDNEKELIRMGYEEDDAISGDLMGDEK